MAVHTPGAPGAGETQESVTGVVQQGVAPGRVVQGAFSARQVGGGGGASLHMRGRKRASRLFASANKVN